MENRDEYPIELIVSFDDDAVTISHGTGHPAGIYQYPLSSLDPAVLDRLLGTSEEVVIYTQGQSYTREEFERIYGSVDLETLQRVNEGE